MEKDFEKFMSQLKVTNRTLDFFCDFGKIKQNVDNIRLSLNMLNSLIGSSDLRKSVETIWNRDKTAFDVLPILIAVRNGSVCISHHDKFIGMNDMCTSVDGVMEFFEGAGLSELLVNRAITNLVDYVFGVETGLDTHTHKNRSGHIMENTISGIFNENGITYQSQVESKTWPTIKKALGTDKKKFDFVVTTDKTIYLIEVNFYNDGGSKPNEVARAYTNIANKVNSVEGFEFVWITDGCGWKSAKNKLEAAYNSIPKVYNLTTISEFVNIIHQ